MYNISPYSLYGVRCWCQSGGGGACFILQAARIQSPLAPPVQKSEQIFDFRTQIHHFLTASQNVTPVTIRPERVNSRIPWIQGNTGLPREGQLIQVHKADRHEIIGKVHRLPRPGSSSRNMVISCGLTGNRETVDSRTIKYRKLN